METLGNRIKKLREDEKMTQLELAKCLFVSDKTISKWEKDNSEPELDIIVKIGQLFHVSTDYLICGISNDISENISEN